MIEPNIGSTYKHMMSPVIIDRKLSIERAIKNLHSNNNHPPPNTYFVRRNT